MQLIALKHISQQRPIGSRFDETDERARLLIAFGVAKIADDEPDPPVRRQYRRSQFPSKPS